MIIWSALSQALDMTRSRAHPELTHSLSPRSEPLCHPYLTMIGSNWTPCVLHNDYSLFSHQIAHAGGAPSRWLQLSVYTAQHDGPCWPWKEMLRDLRGPHSALSHGMFTCVPLVHSHYFLFLPLEAAYLLMKWPYFPWNKAEVSLPLPLIDADGALFSRSNHHSWKRSMFFGNIFCFALFFSLRLSFFLFSFSSLFHLPPDCVQSLWLV
jgi:hypothetical protein